MSKYRFETLQVHAGQEPDSATGATAVPVYQTTSYTFKSCQHAQNLFGLKAFGNIYSRLTNPTCDVLERRIAALEGGVAALSLASGSAAITLAIQNITLTGQNIVAANTLYGGTYNLFAQTFPKQYGIKVKFVNSDDLSAFENAIDEDTRAIYIESLGNPNINIVDIEAVAKIAHDHGIPLIVDNTFGTPYLIRPFEFGADIVVHSATKFIGGHGTTLGGLIIDSGKFVFAASGRFSCLTDKDPSYHGLSYTETFGQLAYIVRARALLLRDTGACLSPFNAFLLLQGLETLSLRVERHIENTMKIISYLSTNPYIEKINHPSVEGNKYNALAKKYFKKGAGSIFSFDIKGTQEQTMEFIDNLEIFSLLANVADVKSLVIHPATTTHSQMSEQELSEVGIYPTTVRVSIGIENAEDLIEDIDTALKKVFKR